MLSSLLLKSYRYIHLDVFTDRIFRRQSARGGARRTRPVAADDAGDRQGDELLRDDVRAAARAARHRCARADLHARPRNCRWPDIRRSAPPTRWRAPASSGRPTASLTLGLTIGPTPVSLEWKGEELGFVWMTQLGPTFDAPAADLAGAAAALRLPVASVAGTGLPVQVVSCGVPFLFVPLNTRRAVDSAILDATPATSFRRGAGIDDVPIFLFSTEAGADDGDGRTAACSRRARASWRIRRPAAPAARSAATCVRQQGRDARKGRRYAQRAGRQDGTPELHPHRDRHDGGAISSVRVGGQSVFVGEGTLYL